MLADQQAVAKATIETVTRVDKWNDRLLTFTTTRGPDYTFAAGQYARLGMSDPHGTIWRAYSMTSAPDDNLLEFYGVIVPGGLFTTRLKSLKPGDPIHIEKQSYGFMTPDRFEDGEDLWMFATGTGIGPYLSMLRDTHVWRKFRNLVLVHGARHPDEFVYHDRLSEMADKPPFEATTARLHVVRAVTREAGEAPILHGRVTTLLENGTLEKAVGLPMSVEASRIMMCGNPQMIEDMRRLLHQRGMRPCRRALPGQFVTENYW
jgi:ferredoxin/flavodoxin---NADP+ reductase